MADRSAQNAAFWRAYLGVSPVPETRRGVDQLPEIDQATYPIVPLIPPRTRIKVFNALGKAEYEWVLECIVTAAFLMQRWIPVPLITILVIAREYNSVGIAKAVAEAIWSLQEAGFLEVLIYEGQDYVVPSAELVGRLYRDQTVVKFEPI